MSNNNTKAAPTPATQSAPATPPVKVLVRINRPTHALRGTWAAGAQVRMSKAKADALVSLGAATIIGI